MNKKTDTEVIIEALANLSEQLRSNGAITADLVSPEALADLQNRRSAELEAQKKEAEMKKMNEMKTVIYTSMGVKNGTIK